MSMSSSSIVSLEVSVSSGGGCAAFFFAVCSGGVEVLVVIVVGASVFSEPGEPEGELPYSLSSSGV